MKKWNKEEIEKFGEDEQLDDDIAEKLIVFMDGQEGTIEVEGQGGHKAELKVVVKLSDE